MVTTSDVPEDPLGQFRGELLAHCYRMLGSSHDAEDVLQEVSLRAWRGRAAFDGRSSMRTWLHRITVNACLNDLERKERRVLPMEFGPAAETHASVGDPVSEVLWLEPFPDDPEQSTVDGESVELAFVAAVQHLPANQRAALIMFDVLGFSAGEIADAMDTTATSVNSAVRRARKLVGERVPKRSQQATLAALGDNGQRKLVESYTAALQDHDIDGMLALLTEDATWSMPPIATWFRGHDAIAAFCVDAPFRFRWRTRPVRANGQLAVGCYWWVESVGAYVAYALNVLAVRVGAVFVPVGDQERALEFYLHDLGFEKRADFPYGDGHRWIEVAPPGAANTIALVPASEGERSRRDEALCAFHTADIEADYATLRTASVEVDAEIARKGKHGSGLVSLDVTINDPFPPQFFFRDTEGNRFLIVEPPA